MSNQAAAPSLADRLVKTCRTCGEHLPLSAFYRAPRGVPRYRPDCKRCLSQKAARYWEERTAATRATAEQKCCAACGQWRPLTDFAPDARGQEGRRSVCEPCRAVSGAEYARAVEAGMPLPDEALPPERSTAKTERMALGIAIAHATCEPDQRRTCEEIAAYAGVSAEAIHAIEQQALQKVRWRLGAVMRELEIEPWEVGL